MLVYFKINGKGVICTSYEQTSGIFQVQKKSWVSQVNHSSWVACFNSCFNKSKTFVAPTWVTQWYLSAYAGTLPIREDGRRGGREKLHLLLHLLKYLKQTKDSIVGHGLLFVKMCKISESIQVCPNSTPRLNQWELHHWLQWEYM